MADMQFQRRVAANAHGAGPNNNPLSNNKAVQPIAPRQLHRHPHDNAIAFSRQAQQR